MYPAPCIISSCEVSNAKRYSKMSRTGRILSRGSRVCRRKWMRMQSADLSAVIAAACRYLGIEEKELARRFNVDRSAISRAGQRVSPRPGTACSHQNDTKRTRTRKKTIFNVPFILRKRNFLSFLCHGIPLPLFFIDLI